MEETTNLAQTALFVEMKWVIRHLTNKDWHMTNLAGQRLSIS